MKKLNKKLLYFFLLIALFSCGGSEAGNDEGDEIAEVYTEGKKMYETRWIVCHQTDGKGLPAVYPPLAGSDYMLADRSRSIQQVMNGLQGEIKVNGTTYNSIMPPQELTEEQMVNVLNYVYNSWGNKGEEFTVEEVRTALEE